jgi:predicted transposase/invertase (TIGR01784 family)
MELQFESGYCIGILDFTFENYENETEKGEVVHTITLKNQNGKTFYEKLTYIYFEMPVFRKAENELETRLDKWLYFIKHLEDFQTIPEIFKDEVFTQAFEKAELAKFGPDNLNNYENSLKVYRDLKGVIDTAFDEGKLARNIEVAKTLKKRKVPVDIIIEATGLSEIEINSL